MDNIIFDKKWQDEHLIELKITADSELVSAYQSCYVQDTALVEISKKIQNYIDNYNESCYLEFGHKEGNYTPAFSMNILPADETGHMKVEVDIEIADNDTRIHRCCFYVKSELGLIERLGISLKGLVDAVEGEKVYLN